MVNTKDFGKRIEKIMDHYTISASAFADAMGVGRSSISHILSGRNKPSLDFVMRIVEAYPEVSLHWLLYNEGSFPPASNQSNDTTAKEVIKTSTTPAKNNLQEPQQASDLFSGSNEEENVFSTSGPKPKEQLNVPVDNTTFTDQAIEKIVLFYKNGTFKSYAPL
ncbi:helix-turn-helix domain-containing protein [Aquimarina brevivitae]|uniref:Helix-turn-helix protein n=1 Tax=Aquimarina brevivitae TaxID=323412 RepID=A0A4Q7P2S7_9FLAO|nr:helix-turn-helix transcriptional regulator [Aquimarina brevivitae]RZS93680.1 helix-turn-helix protein [Aquimarina brevivitae]